ncbi:hypothetical protein, partial [Mycobacterium sp.]|uniref:hypothetical protein n=1 Tax=Mycobacterium sp. TaxID=1785 RepID=UPI003F9D1E9D
MRLLEYEFRHIRSIEPVRDANGSVRQFMPQNLYKNVGDHPLNKYGRGPFCKFRITSQLRVSGVDVLCVGDEIRYIGECAK